jgi:predicted house-cleaning noncanonical NTP pyrophosphatase (MazG superfamily)
MTANNVFLVEDSDTGTPGGERRKTRHHPTKAENALIASTSNNLFGSMEPIRNTPPTIASNSGAPLNTLLQVKIENGKKTGKQQVNKKGANKAGSKPFQIVTAPDDDDQLRKLLEEESEEQISEHEEEELADQEEPSFSLLECRAKSGEHEQQSLPIRNNSQSGSDSNSSNTTNVTITGNGQQQSPIGNASQSGSDPNSSKTSKATITGYGGPSTSSTGWLPGNGSADATYLSGDEAVGDFNEADDVQPIENSQFHPVTKLEVLAKWPKSE